MTLPPIIHEDDELVVFDKPAGLSVSPDRANPNEDTLMDRVHAALGRQVAAVHRLDTGASGAVLCAKTKAALDYLSGQFQSKTAERTHIALAVVLPVASAMKVVAPLRGEDGALPAAFTVELALDRDPERQGRTRVFRKRGGKPAETSFRVLESFGRFVLLECRPRTGAPHQIRVHLAAAGAPVLNDALYGNPEDKLLLSGLKRRYKGREEERPLIGRLALHASGLAFTHPVTRLPVTVSAPPPHDFEVALKYLRLFPPAAGTGESRKRKIHL